MVRPSARPRRLGGSIYRGGYWSRTLKSNEVGNGSQGRRTAEGTVLEIRLTVRMVVMAMVGKSTAVRRTELEQKGAPARGHEPHGNIGAKQKRGQPYDGRYSGSPSVSEPSLHGLGALPCQSQRHCSTGAHAAAFIALIPASHRLYVRLGSATESGDSFPLTDGGRLPADRMFRAELTSRS